MIKRLLFSLIFLPIFGFSQNPFPENGEVFRDDIVPRIDITLPEDSLNWLLAPGNEESNHHIQATFTFDNENNTETIENIGFRLRGNTSRYADKKSFKISFNTYEAGRKFYGLEKLNINGEHNDPTVARAKICWDLARQFGIPAPRSNHIQLYINGNYFGLYINVEHIDEEFVLNRFGNKDGNLFKCLYPADLDYKGSSPSLYKEEFWGRRAYELRTNEEADNYNDIAHFIDVLNNTPIEDLACELERVFNINSYLKSMALDILTGNWDGPLYNKNNFYLYHNTETDKFEYIPYDLDNTLGIDWLNRDWGTRDMYDWGKHGEPRPLYFRLMEVQEYRDRFSYFMLQYLNGALHPTTIDPYLDDMRDLIDEFAENDPLRPQDYGFSYQNFLDAFDEPLTFASQTADYGIKDFVQTRFDFCNAQIEINPIAPIILEIENNHPTENQDIFATATLVETDHPISIVEFCYQIDNQGNTTCLEMLDDGLNNDDDANDGTFGISIPALGEAGIVNYFVQVTDGNGLQRLAPVCGFQDIFVGSSSATLAINEFMASNNSTIADEFGEFDDWVEIYNYGDATEFLGNKFLSDNPDFPDKWAMPTVTIAPGEFVVIWVDDDNNQGNFHANFKLNSGGEFIGIFDSGFNNFGFIDGIEFGEQNTDVSHGRLPNGIGAFQDLSPTPGASNMPVSTKKIENQELSIDIFPNPFDNSLNIVLNNFENEALQILINDVTGKTIFETKRTYGKNSEIINTTNFPQGLYLLVLKKDGEIVSTKKIVK